MNEKQGDQAVFSLSLKGVTGYTGGFVYINGLWMQRSSIRVPSTLRSLRDSGFLSGHNVLVGEGESAKTYRCRIPTVKEWVHALKSERVLLSNAEEYADLTLVIGDPHEDCPPRAAMVILGIEGEIRLREEPRCTRKERRWALRVVLEPVPEKAPPPRAQLCPCCPRYSNEI